MNVVITGASRGLGKAIAEKFAANGHHLFLCSQNAHKLNAVAVELMKQSPSATVNTKAFDLSLKSNVQAFGDWLLSSASSIDVLVNNAGSFIPGNVSDEPDDALEKMININLYSAYHLTRKLLPKMIKQQSGHIFNICSIAGLKAYNHGGAYSISKFALAGFSKNLREEMQPHGIKVTTVFPGAVYTDSWAGSGIDPKRIMEAQDIAALVYASALLSPQACVEDIVVRPQLGDL